LIATGGHAPRCAIGKPNLMAFFAKNLRQQFTNTNFIVYHHYLAHRDSIRY